MDKLHLYDGLVSILMSDLKNMADHNVINLGNFNPKDENHLCIFYIARLVQDVFGLSISVELSRFEYLKFIFKYHCRKKVKRCKSTLVINCIKLTSLVEEANTKDILADIYNQYYRGRR